MTKEALAKVVQRAISDAGFRRQLNSDPAGALRGFDLSADELSALRTGNAGRLATLGVDQRMSKAFVIGGVAAATRMAQSDLSAGNLTAFDGGSGAAGRTIVPHDPESALTADIDGVASSKSRIADDPDGFLAANARASGGAVAPVEGSPEASAADIASGGGMASYPAHGGLAGPSQVASARAGDDWARAGTTRLDDASGSSRGASVVNDDPDGFLAANKNADFSGGTTRAINDDADGFLAANANADLSGGTSRGDGTAFVDESEAYLTKVGYDANAATSAVTDAHDRGSLGSSAVTDAHDRGDVTRIDDDADGSGTSAASEGGPNLSS